MSSVIGVLPAAGYATRLQPLEGSKEILPVGGRPVIDYVVERMRAGGCDELRIVTRPEKTDVIEHATRIGARTILGSPATVTQSFAAGIADVEPEDVILLGWPDSLWDPVDGYRQLLDVLDDEVEIVLGLFKLDHDLERSDVVRLTDDGRVAGVDIKPKFPQSDLIWGCAAARAHRLAGLAEVDWPGEHWDRLVRQGLEIAAVHLSDRWLDVGTHEALADADAWLAR